MWQGVLEEFEACYDRFVTDLTADFITPYEELCVSLNRQVSVVATASFYKMVLLGIAGLFLLLVLGLLLSIHLSVKIVSKKEL